MTSNAGGEAVSKPIGYVVVRHYLAKEFHREVAGVVWPTQAEAEGSVCMIRHDPTRYTFTVEPVGAAPTDAGQGDGAPCFDPTCDCCRAHGWLVGTLEDKIEASAGLRAALEGIAKNPPMSYDADDMPLCVWCRTEFAHAVDCPASIARAALSQGGGE